MTQVQISPVYRLSVIIPSRAWPSLALMNRRALAERAIGSVLQEIESGADPIGTEIVYADGTPADGTADHVEGIFGDAIAHGRLIVVRSPGVLDLGRLRNLGAQQAHGSCLAFLDVEDWWRPGRLRWLEPLLRKHDLILATDQALVESADWIRAFLAENRALTSSAVIRRTLFDEVGGFPENIAVQEDYEFWLKCLARLTKTDRRERFLMTQNQHVVDEPSPEPEPARKLLDRVRAVRELITLLHLAPSLPRRYWITLAQRVAGVGKSALGGKQR